MSNGAAGTYAAVANAIKASGAIVATKRGRFH